MSSFNIIEGSTEGYADTSRFLETLPSVLDPLTGEPFFKPSQTLIVTRAPGRLDVMGGIADYSGSLVLQLPIANATHVALQRVPTSKVSILSVAASSDDRHIEIKLNDFLKPDHEPIDYADACRRFGTTNDHWAAYIAGAFLVLMREKKVSFDGGVKIVINSDVPEGKGVSSSAAVEVATMQAIVVAFDVQAKASEIAKLCQKVENLIAGAPCGIMDQMTSACGEKNRLLELLCQPDVLKGTLAIPDELAVWGIDSGVRHSVSGSDYGTVRTAAFMGYRIIAEVAGLDVQATDSSGKVKIADDKWNGYLANLTTNEFEQNYLSALPETLSGATFLERYSGITDSVTNVDPSIVYPIRAATRHPIYEHERVRSFESILKNWHGIKQGSQLGSLMFGSHQSYSDCGLGSEATDLIAHLVLDEDGLFGARITGGGSGGTVAVLGRNDAVEAIEHLKQKFYTRTGRVPLVISGSSSGAGIFNHLKVEIV